MLTLTARYPSNSSAPQQVVCLDRLFDVVQVDADSHTHQHVLGPLNNLAVQTQQVGALQGLQQRQGRHGKRQKGVGIRRGAQMASIATRASTAMFQGAQQSSSLE